MPIIDVPNVGRVEFPDGMSEKDMVAAIKRNALNYAPKPDPTEGMSGVDKFRAGMGKAFYDVGRGLGQLTGFMSQQEIDDAKAMDAPLLKTGAGTAGNIVGNMATLLPTALIPGANTVSGATAIGALSGAVQPVASDESRSKNATIGGLAGFGGQTAANVIGRAVRPVQSVLPSGDADLASKAGQFMTLNNAQKTGSKPLAWIDSALDNLPFTADKQAQMKLAQRQAWQSQLLNKVGENADNASPDVLGAAYTRLGNQFRDLSARNTVTLGNDFLDKIVAIDSTRTPFSKGINDVIDNALELASKGTLSGKEYQNVRTSLTNASKGAWATNPELGQALKTLRNSLDEAANNSISAEDKAAWNLVREQYKTLKSLTKAADSTTGIISPKKFSNELDRVNPQGMKYGFGNQEVPDLARIGRKFVAENLPDSGTAQRSWYMNALQNPSAGIGGVLGFLHGGPVGAAVGAAAGAATPLAAQRALWSQGRYLTDGVFDPAIIQRGAPYANAGLVGGLLGSQ